VRPSIEARCPPVIGEVTTRHRVGDQSGIGCTYAAVYGRVCSTMDWAFIGHLSDRRGRISSSARDIPLVFRSVNNETGYKAVSMDGRNEGEGGGKER